MGIYDHPAYANHAGGKGPRTKRQRRILRDAVMMQKLAEQKLAHTEEAIRRESMEPTLHSVDWRP